MKLDRTLRTGADLRAGRDAGMMRLRQQTR